MVLRPNVWVFGSGNGHTYADNSRALFEYVTEHEPGITAVWLTQDERLLQTIRAGQRRAYLFSSREGRRYALQAKVIVISNSFLDVGLLSYVLLPRRKRIIQLWHGTPLKVLENKVWSGKQKLLLKSFLAYIGRDCDMVISATERNTKAYIRNFRVTPDKIKITGQPRNDYLFAGQPGTTKKIWYIPTFRDYDEHYDFFAPNGFDAEAFNTFLKQHNAELYLKLHHVDVQKSAAYLQQFEKLSNIHLTNPDNLYEELGKADILLTDYSSVYFDFLLLDRPIIFTAFDYEKYKQDRNFYYNYNEVTPGPKVSDWNGVIDELQALFAGKDQYRQQRQATARMFNTYLDDKSCERTLGAIKENI